MKQQINAKRTKSIRWDISRKPWTDSTNSRWFLSVELKSVNGRTGPVALLIEPTVSGQVLSRKILRELPVTALIREEVAMERELIRHVKARRDTVSHSGRAHTDDELQVVAKVYLEAFNTRKPVQKTVAEVLGIPRSTAIKRIMAARSRGLIPAHLNQKGSQ